MMMKREDAKIYIASHKQVDYGIWDNSLYTPIQVGFDEKRLFDLRDDDGDNISEWNGLYAETTGLYWIWKNGMGNADYIGFCQYRRRLEFEETFDFGKAFEDADVILAAPCHTIGTVGHHYMSCHNERDLSLMGDIVKKMHPDYHDDFIKMINGHTLHYSNGFVMKRNDFINYCEWLFPMLEEFRKERNFSCPSDVERYVEDYFGNISENKGGGKKGNAYQCQILGFLSERLLTLYSMHNFKNITLMNYTKFEGC